MTLHDDGRRMRRSRPGRLRFPAALAFAGLAMVSSTGSAAPRSPAAQSETPRRIGTSEQVVVNLVLIDVVVRDRKDQPVTGLTRGDFGLLVDRRPIGPEAIETFEEICEAAPAVTAQAGADQSAPEPAPAPPAAPGPAAPRHLVLYFDFTQLSLSARYQALKAARQTMERSLTPHDRVMILAFKRQLRLVQDFTSDAGTLTARIAELEADIGTLDSDVLEEGRNLEEVALKPCDADGAGCSARRSMAEMYATQEQWRAERSVRTIRELMPAMAGLRGRKALVLFTDTLRDEPGVQYLATAGMTPRDIGINMNDQMLELGREANAAGVSIYTVHSIGLDDATMQSYRDARAISTTISGGSTSIASSSSIDGPGLLYNAARAGEDAALALQTTLAVETGGRALQRTNELGRIFTSAQQDLSCYYLIGYRYDGHGDGARHSLLLSVRDGSDGERRRGMTLRYRPYFHDDSAATRRDRLIRSALDVPDLHRGLRVETEAFSLAPEKKLLRVLVKTTVPIAALSLIPAGETLLEGRVLVRGEIVQGHEIVCQFSHELPLRVPRGAALPERLVFETGCKLAAGRYDLTVAVLDSTTMEVGGRHAQFSVSAVDRDEQAWISEIHLWARDPDALLITAGGAAIGLKDSTGERAFIPRAQRRLSTGQEALLSFALCPPGRNSAAPDRPIRIHRTLHGEADAEVAGFRDLVLEAPPDAATGCYQITNTIPVSTLGSGYYSFKVAAHGQALGAPIELEAGLAVD